jgi:hypothetical protein
MHSATGVITVVQEGRFRIVLPNGRSILFALAHNALIEPQDLPALAAYEVPVTVHFEDGPHLDARIAYDLTGPT